MRGEAEIKRDLGDAVVLDALHTNLLTRSHRKAFTFLEPPNQSALVSEDCSRVYCGITDDVSHCIIRADSM